MKEKKRALGVDEQIKVNLREPDRYAFEATVDVIHTPQGEDPAFNENALFRMTEAGLAGRLTYFEKQLAFAPTHTERAEARTEMARTRAEQTRRKATKYSEATAQAFFAEQTTPVAVNDAEANWQRVTRKAA